MQGANRREARSPPAPNKKRTKKLHKKWSFFYWGRSEPSGVPKDAASLGWSCLARVRTRSEAPCRARTGGKPGVRPPPIKKGQKSSIKNGAFFIGGGASHPGSPKMQHLWGGAAWLACGLEVKRHAGREPAGSPESARPQ